MPMTAQPSGGWRPGRRKMPSRLGILPIMRILSPLPLGHRGDRAGKTEPDAQALPIRNKRRFPSHRSTSHRFKALAERRSRRQRISRINPCRRNHRGGRKRLPLPGVLPPGPMVLLPCSPTGIKKRRMPGNQKGTLREESGKQQLPGLHHPPFRQKPSRQKRSQRKGKNSSWKKVSLILQTHQFPIDLTPLSISTLSTPHSRGEENCRLSQKRKKDWSRWRRGNQRKKLILIC